MTKALVLTRLFFLAGHRVVGADFSSFASGRVSRSISKFYRLASPDAKGAVDGTEAYIDSLLQVIRKEGVDLWVSCSGVSSAVEDGVAKEAVEKHTKCKAVQFNAKDTTRLHEKDKFMAEVQRLNMTVPETHEVSTTEQALRILVKDRVDGVQKHHLEKKFILKNTGMDDKSRGDMTLLPLSTIEATKMHLQKLQIDQGGPWILQEFIKGREYCTHSLVIKGVVKAFVACPSSDMLMHYEALPSDIPLSRAMLDFTKTFAEDGDQDFTGHLSFDFLVKEEDVDAHAPEDIRLYPIECNPRCHTADVLFNGTLRLAEAYLEVLEPRAIQTSRFNGYTEEQQKGDLSIITPSSITPSGRLRYYWIGHDVVQFLLLPLLQLLVGQATLSFVMESLGYFLDHLVHWKDGIYEPWDPLPFWWLYQVYWPVRFAECLLTGKRWSKMNVSTTKMFLC